MGITNFSKTFGAPGQDAPASNASGSNNADREPSLYWLNIGVESGDRFVSLPLGVPLDNQKPIAIRGGNEDFNAFTSARNDLLAQLMAIASKLEPGEDRIVGLQVQLRRINGEQEAPAVDDSNKYRVMLTEVE